MNNDLEVKIRYKWIKLRTYTKKKQYSTVKLTVQYQCNGEAHSNPFIDHCMVCLHGDWGWCNAPKKKIRQITLQ